MRDRLEKLCEALVLAGPDDTDQLQQIEQGFKDLVPAARKSSQPVVVKAIEAICERLARLRNGEEPHPDASFSVINRAVESLQSVVCEGRNPNDVSFPDDLTAPEAAVPVSTPAEPEGKDASSGSEPPQVMLDAELVKAFIQEANEHIEAIESHLLASQHGKHGDEAINAIFRAFHTIKGAAAFLNLGEIGRLAHGMEDVLDRVRSGTLSLDESVADLAFETADVLKQLINNLRGASAGPVATSDPRTAGLLVRIQACAAAEKAAPFASTADAAAAAQRQASYDVRVETSDTIRVDSERLDRLLETIGELVIGESMVSHSPEIRSLGSADLERALGQLDKITRSLQEMSTSLHMVSIKPVFRRMARLVRDLARKARKQVEFITAGEDTELDKAMVDRIIDPLVHILRNAIDHGIEASPAERTAAGKTEVACVVLRAFHRGGNIFVEVEDDGRGMDRKAIHDKAVDVGLISKGETVPDDRLLDLIFEPGFSTAKKVSDVSGRGVGMDVVKKAVESLRGNVLVRSQPGAGSTITLVLPLTMAIIDGMMVRSGREIYIIPTLSVVEAFRPTGGELYTVVRKGEMVSFRGTLVPLFRLSRLFTIADAVDDPGNALVVVVEDSGKHTGILVDELLGQQQTVIKSLGGGLGRIPGISGACIMADGRAGLILDVPGIVRLATTESARIEAAVQEPAASSEEKSAAKT